MGTYETARQRIRTAEVKERARRVVTDRATLQAHLDAWERETLGW